MSSLSVDRGRAVRARWNDALASFNTHACLPCSSGPSGKAGHAALRYVMVGPETDRSFFRCSECGERWIRSAGMACRFTWARYAVEAPSPQHSGPRHI